VTTVTKARLIYLLLVASVFAYAIAWCASNLHGMNSGGGWL